MKKVLFIKICLLFLICIFGSNLGITESFAAGEVYAIYQGGRWYPCDSNGGNPGTTEIKSGDLVNVTHAFIGENEEVVQNGLSTEFSNLKKIVFKGDKVKLISQRAFWKSQALTNVIIPESVSALEHSIFYNCSKLENVALMSKGTIYTNASSPHTFSGTNSNLRVYVYPANKDMIYLRGGKVPYKTVIEPPTNVNLDLNQDVKLSWTASEATSYKILRSETKDGNYISLAENLKITSYTDKTAQKGKLYWYKLYAVYDTSKISNWQNGPILESEPALLATSFFISKVSSERNSINNAVVKFTSNFDGMIYREVVNDGDPTPVINMGGYGPECKIGENAIYLNNLTEGPKDIYIVVKDKSGNLSNVLKIDIDYDETKAHKLIYNGNGNTEGDVSASKTYYEGDKVRVASRGNLSKERANFLGWNTQKDGKGRVYKEYGDLIIEKEDIILYAQWTDGIRYEAEKSNMLKNSQIGWFSGTSEGGGARVWIEGDYIEFTNVDYCSNILVRYLSKLEGTVSVYINNEKVKSLKFNPTFTSNTDFNGAEKYKDISFDRNIPKGSTIKFQNDSGDASIFIDYIEIKGTPVDSINLGEGPVNIIVGQQKILNAEIVPNNATNKNLIWNSSDVGVATVENGRITPIAEGITTITATTDDNTKMASCEVVVTSADCPIKYKGVEKKFDEIKNTNNIVFFATIDTLNAEEVGFIFSKSKQVPIKGKVKDSNIKSTTHVYKSLTVNDTDITAESKGGVYIVACTVEDILEKDYNKPLYFRCFVIDKDGVKYTPVYMVKLEDI